MYLILFVFLSVSPVFLPLFFNELLRNIIFKFFLNDIFKRCTLSRKNWCTLRRNSDVFYSGICINFQLDLTCMKTGPTFAVRCMLFISPISLNRFFRALSLCRSKFGYVQLFCSSTLCCKTRR